MLATSDEPMSMDSNTSCDTLPVAQSKESFTLEEVETSLGTLMQIGLVIKPIQIGLVIKPITGWYPDMHSSTQEELCHVC